MRIKFKIHTNNVERTMKLIFGSVFVLNLALLLGTVWLGGSVITSGVKAVAENCDSRYPVEAVFSGDWFCPEQKNE